MSDCKPKPIRADFPDGRVYITGFICGCCNVRMRYVSSDRHWEDTATYHDYVCPQCGETATNFQSDFEDF